MVIYQILVSISHAIFPDNDTEYPRNANLFLLKNKKLIFDYFSLYRQKLYKMLPFTILPT